MEGHPNRRLTPVEIIRKMIRVSNTNFSGKIYDNILTIFESLSKDEQKDLLRSLICMNITATSQVGYIPELIEHSVINKGAAVTLSDLGVITPTIIGSVPLNEAPKEEPQVVTLADTIAAVKSIATWTLLLAGMGFAFFWLTTTSAEDNPHVATYVKSVFDLFSGFF